MFKRLMDLLGSVLGLVLISPVLLPVMFLVWWEDRHSPFYIAPRVGRGGHDFAMVKMRSMVVHADKLGASSTSNADRRITPVGHFIRRFKIDELTQLWNVLLGDMSLVGPRPQVRSGVDLYTARERELLQVRPGITDFASIVFSDEGAILNDGTDPDADYDRLIRPWKSRLGLAYIAARSIQIDIALILLTVVAIFSREHALAGVAWILERLGAGPEMLSVCRRKTSLQPGNPPDGDYVPFEHAK